MVGKEEQEGERQRERARGASRLWFESAASYWDVSQEPCASSQPCLQLQVPMIEQFRRDAGYKSALALSSMTPTSLAPFCPKLPLSQKQHVPEIFADPSP